MSASALLDVLGPIVLTTASRSKRFGLLLAGSLALAWTVTGAAPARAQSGTGCPTQFLPLLATVELTQPEAGATVSGRVTVAGEATGPLLNHVELVVRGEVVASRALEGDGEVKSFALTWDASSAPTGITTLQVVACGDDGAIIPKLVGGKATREVRVQAPAPTTTSAPSTTVARRAPAAPAAPGGPTSTAAAPGVGASADSTTTSVAATSTTAGEAADDAEVTVPAERGEPSESEILAGPARPGALTLTEGSDDSGPGPPLWVGIVVGISGTIGLLLSALFRRSHAEADDDEEEYESELDPDLVEVS